MEIGLAGISLAESKTEPPAYFFSVVAKCTSIVLLMMKQFEDPIYAIIKLVGKVNLVESK